MSIALQFDGVDDYLSIPSWGTAGDFTITGTFDIILGASFDLFGSSSDYVRVDENGFLNVVINSAVIISNLNVSAAEGTEVAFSLTRTGTTVSIDFGGITDSGTSSGAFSFSAIGYRATGTDYYAGKMYNVLTLSHAGDTRTYDFPISSGTGTVTVQDTTSSQDATGINFPIDGSAWITPLSFNNLNEWLDTLAYTGSTTERLILFLRDQSMTGGLNEMLYEYVKTKSSTNSHSERMQEWKNGGYN